MRRAAWICVFVAACLGGCGTPGQAVDDLRVAQARELGELQVNWFRGQVVASVGRPDELLGPFQLTDTDWMEIWTYYLAEAGTSVNTPPHRRRVDRSAGMTLIMHNERLIRKASIGSWGYAAHRAYLNPRKSRKPRSLDQRQGGWLAGVRQQEDVGRKLDAMKKELFEASQEKLPGMLADDKLAPPRGHPGAYVTVGQ